MFFLFIFVISDRQQSRQRKGQPAVCQREKGREEGREGGSERACDGGSRGKGGEEKRIRSVERMSVAGKTKEGRLRTVFCCAESTAEHRERRGHCVGK